jgi:hypothetical protein
VGVGRWSVVTTETQVDLEEMLAAELPPCEVATTREEPLPICGQPSVAVAILRCACGDDRVAVCAPHLVEVGRNQYECGNCETPGEFVGLA